MKNCLILLATVTILVNLPGLSQAQNSAIFSRKVGQYVVTTLTESRGQGNKALLIGATAEILERYAPDGTFPNAIHAYLVQSQGRNVLIDAGMGKLISNLEAGKLKPEQIDGILLTHCHGDHIGGMMKNETAVFPNAHVYLSQKEYDYWTTAARGEQARKVFEAYKGRIHIFEPATLGGSADPIIPGLKAYAAYGHTPGHIAYLLESGAEKLLIWGDLTHAMAVQMPCPQVALTYDVDPAEAIKSRKEVLEYVVRHSLPVAGMHIPLNGMGKVENDPSTGGYRFTGF
ncbi:MAG: MBL fold metallo-hydrolase [Tannerellaceae bacterium]|jgi:glyoxylase-like metal-dependent hydrolase (beta-lactamase superfamily II)|nr:MBL fold metallo-hydrolase [Tannerellaceae bacterium]